MRLRTLFTVAALGLTMALPLAAVTTTPAAAKVFRWANDGDVNSMDPYARNETFLLSFNLNIYEPLVRRTADLKKDAALATEWKATSPTVWQFKLRQGVKFSDGTPFNADDVIFSYQRAVGPGSNIGTAFASVKEVRKVDDYTVEVETKYPNPIFVDEITNWGIMSKVWAEKNNALNSADLTKNEENFATRNAMGTGPFMLKSREPDVKTVLVPNPGWWDKPEHNLTEVVFQRIANGATRVAALKSGEVDMVYTIPPQDVEPLKKSDGIAVLEAPETRIVYLGFDQSRDELLYSNIKGKNPFKDPKVRQAFWHAIDTDAIKSRVMRGQSQPVALMWAPGINGYTKDIDIRPKYDPEASKKLLAEAGYDKGFELTLDCPNDRYVNDEAICQAVTAMLARVGVKVNLRAQNRLKYFAQILGPKYDTSFYMLGWTPTTYDAHNAMQALMQTRDNKQIGLFNVGGYSNKKFDDLANAIAQELDQGKRDAMIKEAAIIHRDEVGHIPLHQQFVVWAARKNISLKQQADNMFPLRFVKVN